MTKLYRPSRRAVLAGSAAFATSLAMPGISRAQSRPVFTHGVQSGDVDTQSGMIWTRTDRPARVMMEVSTKESFADPVRLTAMNALPESDFAIKRLVSGLPSDQDIFYRFTAADLSEINVTSEPVTGHFRTAPTSRRSVRFAWSGDTAGQGWGIDDDGMATYATMARHKPDFFIHSGDTIYADGPMQDEVEKDGAVIWKNTTLIDAKRKMAETLQEYRDQWKYNMMDRHVQNMNATVPTFFQWDDHEVVNNWSDSKDMMADDRYTEKSVHLLVARADGVMHGAYDEAEATARIQAFETAGADCVYVPVLPDLEAVRRICASVKIPVNVLAVGAMAHVSRDTMAAAGVARISVGAALARTTHKVLIEVGQKMLSGDFSSLGGIDGEQVDALLLKGS
ncbi:alkaline phosphatase D family protein [Halovulum sp. GXIMD14793]